MAKKKKVKGICAHCNEPVVSGGKREGNLIYHNPCYTDHSYGPVQNIKKGQRPRRMSPPEKEINARSVLGLDATLNETGNPGEDLNILAHARNVTLASNPAGEKSAFFVWEGPRTLTKNMVRFPTYKQANNFYRDAVDGKYGMFRNNPMPAVKIGLIVIGLAGAVALGIYLYKKRNVGALNKLKEKATEVKDNFTNFRTDYSNSGNNDGVY
jgi:hypothetical protein